MNIRTLCTLLLAPALALLAACGGNAGTPSNHPDDGGLDAQGLGCGPAPCPSSAVWDYTLCACVADDGGTVVVPPGDACTNLVCPSGTYSTSLNGSCVCQVVNDVPDATEDQTAEQDAPTVGFDAPIYYYDAPVYYYDSPVVTYDAPYPYCSGDASCADVGVYCNPNYYYCGPGYTISSQYGYCQCVACGLTCPNGQTPGQDCNSCVACTTACPAGFYAGPNCACIPDGVDAGPPNDSGPYTADGGFAGCTLEGYQTCGLNSWCQLGTCPDNKTEYGCFCDSTGKATCNLACPAPKPCNIPGLGTCMPGQQCIYGADACQGDSGTIFACSCNSGSSAYCNSVSCAYASYYLPEGGPETGAADAGPSCYLQGYTQCPVGQYCQLGTCPGGSSYGCTCNADGTTTCNLQCPPPPPCSIPGVGTCPNGQYCTFGTCSSNSDSLLYCSCYNGSASCYTSACTDAGGGD